MRTPKSARRSTQAAGLAGMDLVAFVPTTNRARARTFFESTLGLSFVSDDGFALVFDVNGISLRVADVSAVKGFRPAPFTVLGCSNVLSLTQ